MKEVILMLYPTRAEATIGFEKVFVSMVDPKTSVRKSDMIETEKVRIHFHSISANYYAWIKGFSYNKVWIDSRINVHEEIDCKTTLLDLINSRQM